MRAPAAYEEATGKAAGEATGQAAGEATGQAAGEAAGEAAAGEYAGGATVEAGQPARLHAEESAGAVGVSWRRLVSPGGDSCLPEEIAGAVGVSHCEHRLTRSM